MFVFWNVFRVLSIIKDNKRSKEMMLYIYTVIFLIGIAGIFSSFFDNKNFFLSYDFLTNFEKFTNSKNEIKWKLKKLCLPWEFFSAHSALNRDYKN